MVQYCSKCGSINDDNSNFCTSCGTKLEGTAEVLDMSVDEVKADLVNNKFNWPSYNDSPILLKSGEELLISLNNVVLKEPRSVRVSKGSYGGSNIRLNSHFSLKSGGGSSKSVSYDEITKIDKGTFYLTTKRIIFIGTMKNINIDMKKIIAVKEYRDGISIQRENKQKIEYFLDTDKSVLNITKAGKKVSFKFTGDILKAAIMGRISRL